MTGPGYALPAVLAVGAVGVLELAVLPTGLFGKPAYWMTMVIVLGFQVPVDGHKPGLRFHGVEQGQLHP